MSTQNKDVEFRVSIEVQPKEVVCVVGENKELGEWLPKKAQQLQQVEGKDLRPGEEEGQVWNYILNLPVDQDIKYRYFTCYIRKADHVDMDADVTITRWETNIKPRVFSPQTCKNVGAGKAVEFGCYDGKKQIDQGWLIGDSEIQLRLHSSPIKFWKLHTSDQQIFRVKCKSMDLRYKEAAAEFDNDIDDVSQDLQYDVRVAVLKEGQAKPHKQGPNGELFRPASDYMLFKAQTPEPNFLGFKLEFYFEHDVKSTDEPKCLGYSYVLPINFNHTADVKSLPINSPRHVPIGSVTVDYVIIKPLQNNPCDMRVSYAKHWKERSRPLNVGHRGSGNSYSAANQAVVRENTIASLSTAGCHGADYVEFDVQLSKDLFPVIYHDFSACITLRKKTKGLEMFEIPVKDLNLQQLQSLKTDHHTLLHDKTKDLHEEDTASEDHHHFPTLNHGFQSIDPHVGFNIEIKYPQAYKDGSHEMDPFFEMNSYVDRILEDVLKNAGSRRIIFSCFHPDVCTMLRRKQNKYPVLYLTKGKFSLRSDPRCGTIDRAAQLAKCENYLGVDVYTEELLQHLEYVKHVKSAGLVMFVWGAIDDTDTLDLLRGKCVDGIIYDRIYELNKDSKKNIFKLEYEEKMQLSSAMNEMS